MRIPNTTTSDALMGNLQRLTTSQSKLQEQVSTGQRFTRASEDPAAAGRVMELQAEKQQLQQFSRNADRAMAITQTTYASISGLKDLSDRAGEIAVLGTGTASPAAQKSYATELNQLIEQGFQSLNTSYNGQHLFAGTKTDVPPFTATRDSSGKITGVTYGGDTASADFRTSEGGKVSPYTSGATNQQFGNFLNRLVTLRDALNSGSSASVAATQANLQSSEDDILTSVSDLGATQTRLEADAAENESRFAELEKQTSAQTDVDLSETVVKLTQAKNSYQAALQTGAQMLNMSLLDYLR